MIIKIFIISSIFFFLALLSGKLYFYNHKNRFIREKSVMISTCFLILYILSSIAASFYVQPIVKPIVLFCAISPFIIGHYATYNKLLFFTLIQLFIVICGVLFIFI